MATIAPHFVVESTHFYVPGEHTTGANPVKVQSENGYEGTVNFTCTLLSGPSSSTPPECAMYPSTAEILVTGSASPQILIFGVGTELPPGITVGASLKWLVPSGAVLAFGLLFAIPARRRAWRTMLSAVLVLVAIGGMSACNKLPKMITKGNYVFAVTGVDSKNPSITNTGKVYVGVL